MLLFIVFYFQKGELSNHKQLKDRVFDKALIQKNGISIDEYGIKGDGVSDDTEIFQYAMDDAVKNDKILIVPANTYVVSPSQMGDSTSACLSVPSNATIYFEPGAKLKLADDSPSWSRVLVIDNVSNIQLLGLLEVDGNASTITDGNEHMAGIFIFNAKDVFIESAYAHDTYGDNLFIGGTEEQYSSRITIQKFRGVTAGRKNVVIHYVDDLHIGTAILDNSRGGVGNSWRGANSLDLEPDNYKGNRRFSQRVDYLSTYGMGNDFTVGTKKILAEKWLLDIGQFNVVLMEGATKGLHSYAVTVKVDRLFLKSSENNEDTGMKMMYAAHWEINEAYFDEGRGYAISASQEHGEKPVLKLGKVFISRPMGEGIELWGADATIDVLEANTVQGIVLHVLSTNPQMVHITNLLSRNSGQSEIIFVNDYGFTPSVTIENLIITDDRMTKAKQIATLYSQNAVDGFQMGNIQNYEQLKEVWFGPDVENPRWRGGDD
nr:glycosyl hydrolase family 28-related protein [Cytobacillus eiseniae]